MTIYMDNWTILFFLGAHLGVGHRLCGSYMFCFIMRDSGDGVEGNVLALVTDNKMFFTVGRM